MASIYKKIQTRFWNDADVVNCFEPDDKLFYLFLMTSPLTTQWGIFEINHRYCANTIGWTLEKVVEVFARFEKTLKKIKYSPETSEIVVFNGLKYSLEGANPSYIKYLISGFDEVKNRSLLKYVSGLPGLLDRTGMRLDLLDEVNKMRDDIAQPMLTDEEAPKAPRRTRKTIEFYEYSEGNIPEELEELKGFAKEWQRFCKSRKEVNKKPLTVDQADGLLDELLEKYKEGFCEPTEVVKRSANSGWQGLFYGGKPLRTRRAKRTTEGHQDIDSSEGNIV